MQIELIIGSVALIVASWQLYLQKKEQVRNSRINSLIYLSDMLQKRINLYSDIINERKKNNQNYKGHAERMKTELKPLLYQTQNELISIISKTEKFEYIDNIKKALENKK